MFIITYYCHIITILLGLDVGPFVGSTRLWYQYGVAHHLLSNAQTDWEATRRTYGSNRLCYASNRPRSGPTWRLGKPAARIVPATARIVPETQRDPV